jgi:integrase
VQRLKKPRGDEKPPFKTYEQIAAIVGRSQLTKHEEAQQWDCLFLRSREVLDLLDYVAMTACEGFVHPMFAFVALTGARRSEMMRSQIEDNQERSVLLREKKRRRDMRISFRTVDLCDELKTILDRWLADHPGGKHTFVTDAGRPLTDKVADGAFKRALRGSKWEVVPGYHCLRHSFASILAMSGKFSQAVIDGYMGHQTEEMRARYRHLFPEEIEGKLNQAFSVNRLGAPRRE